MRELRTALFGLVLGVGIGCSSSSAEPNFGGEDGRQIATLIDRMNDESRTVSKLKEVFASGAPIGKKEISAYSQSQYGLKGKPAVNGTTASVTVVIEKQSGGGAVEKEWTFVKEGDKWKIRAAPMP